MEPTQQKERIGITASCCEIHRVWLMEGEVLDLQLSGRCACMSSCASLEYCQTVAIFLPTIKHCSHLGTTWYKHSHLVMSSKKCQKGMLVAQAAQLSVSNISSQ